MARIIEIGKGSEFYRIYSEYWNMAKFYVSSAYPRSREYWENFHKTVEAFQIKYQTSKYAQEMGKFLISQMEAIKQIEKKWCVHYSMDIQKGSEFFQMHEDYWRFVTKYINGDEHHEKTDVYWDEVISQAGVFRKEHPSEYAYQLMLVFLEELDRIWNEECTQTKVA